MLRVLTIREAIASGPSHTVASSHSNLAWLARTRGDSVRAETHILRAIEEYEALGDRPASLHAYTQLAKIHLERGRFAEARVVLERELATQTDTTEPRHALRVADAKGVYARALWELGSDRERAIELVREALEALKGDEHFPDSHEELRAWLDAHASL